MATTPAKKTAAKKTAAKKTTSSKSSGSLVKDAPTKTAEAKVLKDNNKAEVKPDVPPVQTHEAMNALNDYDDYEAPKTEVIDVDFVYPQETDPNRRLPGGVYLDQVQRQEAEIQRAKVEGREPDLENPPAVQGTPLISKDQFLNAGGSYYHDREDELKVTTLPVTVVKD